MLFDPPHVLFCLCLIEYVNPLTILPDPAAGEHEGVAGSTGISHTHWAKRGAPSVFPQVESLPGGRKFSAAPYRLDRNSSTVTPMSRHIWRSKIGEMSRPG
jgi:hypothetical protein